MTMGRMSIGFAVAMLLGGCHLHPFRAAAENCHKPQVYQSATSVAPLIVPSGFTTRASGVVTVGVLSGGAALATWVGSDSRGACPKRIFSRLPGFSTVLLAC